ncbi:AEC family transporter [Aquicoccus sp. SCR17]|nr:AEC family transporter [Carideicomes alvinocaridis]
MNLVLTVLQIVSPIFLLAAAGIGWVRLGFDYPVEFVTRLVMTLSVPCLIFTALMRTEVDPAALAALSMAALAAYLAVIMIVLAGVKVLGMECRTYAAPLIFGNTGNIGLPVAVFAFGEAGLGYAVVVFAVTAVLNFTVGVWLVSGGGAPWRVMKDPMVLATLLGALFLWQGWETPAFLTEALRLMGQLAIPMMLLTLGVAVAQLRPGRIARALWLSPVKLLVCALAGWITGGLFGLDETALAVLVLQLATPVGVTSYLLARRHGADADAVAGLVVVSTLMSVATLPVLLALLL